IGVEVPEAESKSDYDLRNGKLFVQAIRVRNSDFAKEVKVNDDDVKKYFDAHKTEFKTEEKRKVEFVALTLTDEQKKLQGKERIDVLQKLADRANEITQSLGEKGADFHQVAAKFQLPVKATGEFTQTSPDPQFQKDQQLTSAAFQLSAQEPTSDAVQTADGFYVLHFAGLTEARPLTFEEQSHARNSDEQGPHRRAGFARDVEIGRAAKIRARKGERESGAGGAIHAGGCVRSSSGAGREQGPPERFQHHRDGGVANATGRGERFCAVGGRRTDGAGGKTRGARSEKIRSGARGVR